MKLSNWSIHTLAEGLGRIGSWCIQDKKATYLIATAGAIIAKLPIGTEPQPDLEMKDGTLHFKSAEAKRTFLLAQQIWADSEVEIDLSAKELEVAKKCFADSETLKELQSIHRPKHTLALFKLLGLDQE